MQVIRWRKQNNLTLSEAAALLGLSGANPARTFQRFETGAARPDADMIEKIVTVTGGAVSAQDMHETRLAWLRTRAAEGAAS